MLLEKGNEHTDEDKIRQMIVCHGHILSYLRKNWAENLTWKNSISVVEKMQIWREKFKEETDKGTQHKYQN